MVRAFVIIFLCALPALFTCVYVNPLAGWFVMMATLIIGTILTEKRRP